MLGAILWPVVELAVFKRIWSRAVREAAAAVRKHMPAGSPRVDERRKEKKLTKCRNRYL